MKQPTDIQLTPFNARVVRVLCCLAIAMGTVICLVFIQQMRSPTSTNTAVLQDSEQASHALLPLMSPAHGNWQVGGIPWHVESLELPPDAADLRLVEPVSLPALTLGQSANGAVADLPKDDDEFAALVHAAISMLGASQTIEAEACVYRLKTPDYCAVAFAPATQPEQIQVIRVTHRLNDQKANFLELRREATDRVTNPQAGKDTLLPPHPDNLRLGIRTDKQGMLTAEFIQLQTDFDRVQSLWRQAGWVLTKPTTPLSGQDDYAIPSNAVTLLATRADDMVLAIATESSDQLPSTLLLVHATQ